MKQCIRYFRKYALWLGLLLGVDVISALILWLADVQAFRVLATVIVLGTVLLFLFILWILGRAERRKEQAFLDFLESGDSSAEEAVLRLVSAQEGEMIRSIATVLKENQAREKELSGRIKDYEEYTEAWAHEIKTPISLLTFLMDNHREELPEGVSRKLDYVRNQMQEYVNQMLYYARLKSAGKDYLFEPLSLSECCEEVLENYRPLLEEKGFQVQQDLGEVLVLSDRRGLDFLLSQFISNSIKYCRAAGTPKIWLKAKKEEEGIFFCVRDNGIGVRSYEIPFLFEKGFTGDTGTIRKKATGMGLYLAKEIADDLKIALDIRTEWQKGFEITLRFSVIVLSEFQNEPFCF
ncbi:HAMP domain-containing sensor histidine kinase [Lachnospiraceae bacterium 46-15]